MRKAVLAFAENKDAEQPTYLACLYTYYLMLRLFVTSSLNILNFKPLAESLII